MSVLFIPAMVFSTTFVAAQEFVYFGAKGGLNFSDFSGDGWSDFDEDINARTAYHLGLLAEVPVSSGFSIQPEVLYSAQGYDILEFNAGEDVEFQLDYITVPVLAKVYLVQGLSLEAGPQLGILVKSEIDSASGSVDLGEDAFNNLDFSFGLGASYKFKNFFIYGRYNAGMTGIYDIEGVEVDAKNLLIQAGVGFFF